MDVHHLKLCLPGIAVASTVELNTGCTFSMLCNVDDHHGDAHKAIFYLTKLEDGGFDMLIEAQNSVLQLVNDIWQCKLTAMTADNIEKPNPLPNPLVADVGVGVEDFEKTTQESTILKHSVAAKNVRPRRRKLSSTEAAEKSEVPSKSKKLSEPRRLTTRIKNKDVKTPNKSKVKTSDEKLSNSQERVTTRLARKRHQLKEEESVCEDKVNEKNDGDYKPENNILESDDNNDAVRADKFRPALSQAEEVEQVESDNEMSPPLDPISSSLWNTPIVRETFLGNVPKTGAKNICIICGKRYKHSIAPLRKHVIDLHAVSWNLYLDLFKQKFESAKEVLKTMRTKLQLQKQVESYFRASIPCPVCEKTFTENRYVIYHVKKMHADQDNLDELVEHIKLVMTKEVKNSFPLVGGDRNIERETNHSHVSGKSRWKTEAKTEKIIPASSVQCEVCLMKFSTKEQILPHLTRSHQITWQTYQDLLTLEDPDVREAELDKLRKAQVSRPKKPRVKVNQHMECIICQQAFTTLRPLASHLQMQHANDSDVTKHVADAEQQFYDNRKSKVGPIVTCPFCNCERKSRESIFLHVSLCHKDKDDLKEEFTKLHATVQTLELQFAEEYSKKKHLKEKELGKRGLICCRYCSKTFTFRSARHRHEILTCESNPDRKPWAKCLMCDFIHLDREVVEQHKATQHCTDGENFICDTCGRGFRYKSGLTKHCREIHTDSKYTCSICDKQFKAYSTFNLHKNRHLRAEESPYLCEVCSKSFKDRMALVRHHKVVHLGKYRFYCEKCGHGVEKKQYLQTHKCGRVRRNQSSELIAGLTPQQVQPSQEDPSLNLNNEQQFTVCADGQSNFVVMPVVKPENHASASSTNLILYPLQENTRPSTSREHVQGSSEPNSTSGGHYPMTFSTNESTENVSLAKDDTYSSQHSMEQKAHDPKVSNSTIYTLLPSVDVNDVSNIGQTEMTTMPSITMSTSNPNAYLDSVHENNRSLNYGSIPTSVAMRNVVFSQSQTPIQTVDTQPNAPIMTSLPYDIQAQTHLSSSIPVAVQTPSVTESSSVPSSMSNIQLVESSIPSIYSLRQQSLPHNFPSLPPTQSIFVMPSMNKLLSFGGLNPQMATGSSLPKTLSQLTPILLAPSSSSSSNFSVEHENARTTTSHSTEPFPNPMVSTTSGPLPSVSSLQNVSPEFLIPAPVHQRGEVITNVPPELFTTQVDSFNDGTCLGLHHGTSSNLSSMALPLARSYATHFPLPAGSAPYVPVISTSNVTEVNPISSSTSTQSIDTANVLVVPKTYDATYAYGNPIPSTVHNTDTVPYSSEYPAEMYPKVLQILHQERVIGLDTADKETRQQYSTSIHLPLTEIKAVDTSGLGDSGHAGSQSSNKITIENIPGLCESNIKENTSKTSQDIL